MEEWKDIDGYNGDYKISNLGNIYSTKSRRLLRNTDNGKGYKIIGLSKNNIRTNFYVHRLVAEAFIRKPNEKEVINHKDYNRSNNSVENLEWLTQLENVRYSLQNKPEITKRTSKWGKYIKVDKRYPGFVVVASKGKKRKYLGRFLKLEDAVAARDKFLEEKDED